MMFAHLVAIHRFVSQNFVKSGWLLGPAIRRKARYEPLTEVILASI